MSRRLWGLILLLMGSEALGILAGHWFFGLFDKTVPPAVITAFNRGAAHGAFIAYGMGLGLAVFLLALTAVALSRFFRAAPGEAGARPMTTPP